MRAWEVRETIGPEGVVLNPDRPAPEPGHGEILVRVRATSLNYRDLMIAKGAYRRGAKPNVIPLSDGAGEIVAVGPGVTRFKVGDRVCGAFFPDWAAGAVTAEAGARALGRRHARRICRAARDGRDRGARSHDARGGRDAALRGAHRMERRLGDREGAAGPDGSPARNGRRVAVCAAVRQAAWRAPSWPRAATTSWRSPRSLAPPRSSTTARRRSGTNAP